MMMPSKCDVAGILLLAFAHGFPVHAFHSSANHDAITHMGKIADNEPNYHLNGHTRMPCLHQQRPFATAGSTVVRASPLDSDADDGSDDSAMDEEERMRKVRELQKIFYSSGSDGETPDDGSGSASDSDSDANSSAFPRNFDPTTGRIENVPLWRVGWTEVPGRTNVLNVHEGHYTNMFETIFARPQPWYFGHLHLPGGSKSLTNANEQRFKLKSWREEIQDTTRFDSTKQRDRSSVVGVLMRATDYRRMTDGRLVILVQATERFVVQDVVESFPYGLATVQILPDREEMLLAEAGDGVALDLPSTSSARSEAAAKQARALAVCKALELHGYEYANTQLSSTKDKDYLSQQDVSGQDIAKVLPFAVYNCTNLQLLTSTAQAATMRAPTSAEAAAAVLSDEDDGSLSLEQQLQSELILRNPPPLSRIQQQDGKSIVVATASPNDAPAKSMTLDELEAAVWVSLDGFCRAANFRLPGEIKFLRTMDPAYPSIRRQQRLSYAVPAILENINIGAGMRNIWLCTPSTHARLDALLERLELLNEAVMGEYE